MLTKEEILEKNGFDFEAFKLDNEYSAKSILTSMDEYANQDKWISCDDKLPEDYQRVLGYVEEINDLGKSHFVWNVSYSKYHGFLDNLKPCRVTHWQPLPEPPKNI